MQTHKKHARYALVLSLLLPALVPATHTRAQVDSEHPWVRTVLDYYEASKRGDLETLRRLQAPGARIWFEAREGPGAELNVAGKGPWGDWDRLFQSESRILEIEVLADAVRVTNLENNDWMRLVERKPVPYYIHYFIDDAGRVAGKLIQAIPGIEREPDRREEFEAWAARRHPGLLERLMPEGKLDPALDKARLWKRHLLEWRAETGLPDVLDEGP